LVAVYAAFHRDGDLWSGDGVALGHGAVAKPALNLAMPRMAEDHVILYDINLRSRERCGVVSQGGQALDLRAVPLHRAMAVHALRHWGERSLLGSFHRGVAVAALNLQRRVLLVAELDRLSGECQRAYGNEKATSESE
jgi:hypothetical protein